MQLKNAINQFYFDMTINELRLMNGSVHFPNITYNSLLYMDIIAYTENCTVSFLAESLHVAKSAVTVKVKELLNQGLLFKKQSTRDKRVFYLYVKEEVIEEYKIYDVALHKAIETVERQYTSEQLDTFCEILQIFSKNYSEGATNLERTI